MVQRWVCVFSLTWIAAVAATPSQSAAPASSFPPGRGRDTTIRVCSGCHAAESAVVRLQTHDDWAKTLAEMADNGAQASEEEWRDILAYLDRSFSRVFINKATAEELEAALDVPTDVADAIVRRRSDKGEFASVDDLKAVPGVADAADAWKDRLIF